MLRSCFPSTKYMRLALLGEDYDDDHVVDHAQQRRDSDELQGILDKICDSSTSIRKKKKAAKGLRLLSQKSPYSRALIAEDPNSIPRLVSVLTSSEMNNDPESQEDNVAAIFHLSLNTDNKEAFGDNQEALEFLVESLEGETRETRASAAAALCSLSSLDSNKLNIGELGALKPLVEMFQSESGGSKMDAAAAIFSLCELHLNRSRAVAAGLVSVVLESINDESLVDESVAILSLVSSENEALEEIVKMDGVPCLLGVVRGSSSAKTTENAVSILSKICKHDEGKLMEYEDEESLSDCFSQLAIDATPKTRKMAAEILETLNPGE